MGAGGSQEGRFRGGSRWGNLGWWGGGGWHKALVVSFGEGGGGGRLRLPPLALPLTIPSP